MDLAAHIRDIPDFPQPGIIFKDITPMLASPEAFEYVIAQLAEIAGEVKPDKILGIESRGFIFGAPLANRLGVGFIPARKPGKLPYKTASESYTLEYGTNTIEVHEDAIAKGEKILVVDDLIATGGTLAAACRLVEKLGGEVPAIAAVIELSFLDGRKTIGDRPIHSLMTF